MRRKDLILCITALAFLAGGWSGAPAAGRRTLPPGSGGGPSGPAQTPKEALGEALFKDPSLSTPDGQSCASCHLASSGFADPDWQVPVSEGTVPGRYGNRNAPAIAYCASVPTFHLDPGRGVYVGGLFRDGRAPDLAAQAARPFLNPLEMNNPSVRAVVLEVRDGRYADLFEQVYGFTEWNDVEGVFDRIVDAIVAFERSPALNRFDSKFDHYLRGEVALLSAVERRGLELFEGTAGCAACHPSRPDGDGRPPLFTDFTYHNLGVPRNPDNPFYGMPAPFNHAGDSFVDLGLGSVIGDPAKLGAIKVPTMRNVAATAPYMHNGAFATLREAIAFLGDGAERGDAEFVPEARPQGMAFREAANRPRFQVPPPSEPGGGGGPRLSEEEVDALHAFLLTLTDGYQP
jgi:cytochrome c peroxidase